MITTLLFDFGDVFLNLDKTATERELRNVSPEGIPSEMVSINQQYETGAISSTTFIAQYQKYFPKLDAQTIIRAWNAILGDLPEHRLVFLEQLAKNNRFRLLLLSNTNALHIDWVRQNIACFHRFKSCFDGFYLSHEIGLRKPHPEVFAYVLKHHDLQANEVLFIDDTEEHCQSASKLGMATWNLQPGIEDVTALFTKNRHLF